MSAPHPIDAAELVRIVAGRGHDRRSVTAVAGAPGSGKSTLAESLALRLNADDPGSAAVFPMDGYHYDNMILNARGWLARKGAPHTFDVRGFARMLARLKENTEEEVAVPVFDRAIETARNSARIIPQTVSHLIVEGNYLLLDAPLWADLFPLYDTSVFLDVPEDELRARLAERWKDLPPEDKAWKLDGNDLPNALTVIRDSRAAEFTLRWP